MAKSHLSTTLGAIFSNSRIAIFFKFPEARVRIGYCRLPEMVKDLTTRFREKVGQRSSFSKISNLGYFWGPFKRVTRISHVQIFDMLWSLTSSVKRSTVCSLVIYITRFSEKTCTRGSRKFQNPLTPETPFSRNSVDRFFPNFLCTGRAPRTTIVTCQISPPAPVRGVT